MLGKLFKEQEANGKTLNKPITHKRNRVVQFLVLPAVVFMWIVGWSLYWLGPKKGSVKQSKIPEQKELSFNVLMSEEKYVTQQAGNQTSGN